MGLDGFAEELREIAVELEAKAAPAVPQGWRKQRMANWPHSEHGMRLIGFVVPDDGRPLGLISERLEEIIGAVTPASPSQPSKYGSPELQALIVAHATAAPVDEQGLPPLPEPYRALDKHLSHPILRQVLFAPGDYYTADQMRDYARAALQSVQPAVPQGEPVHQFRKVHCADWYDGHPDHGGGGGPYEERTLYTAAPSQERCCTCGYLTSEREHLGCLRKAVKDLDAATGGPYPSQPVTRPQNCGTSFCSCIECVCEPEPVTLTEEEKWSEFENRFIAALREKEGK